MKVIDICPQCVDATQVMDYYWDNETRQYTAKVKKVGYLCNSTEFSRKHYREPDEQMGEGCKHCRKGICGILHNNQILVTKKK